MKNKHWRKQAIGLLVPGLLVAPTVASTSMQRKVRSFSVNHGNLQQGVAAKQGDDSKLAIESKPRSPFSAFRKRSAANPESNLTLDSTRIIDAKAAEHKIKDWHKNATLAFLKEQKLLASTKIYDSVISGEERVDFSRRRRGSCNYPGGSACESNFGVSQTTCTLGGGTFYTQDNCAAADSSPPVVNSITVSGSPSANATSVTFSVDFDESANNVSTDDFSLTTTGTATGTIASVSASSGDPITVTVNSITGTGTIRLDLKASTNITDGSGNGNGTNGHVAAYSSGSSHTVDRDAPAFNSAGSTPNDNATDVAIANNIVVDFNENIVVGTGNITIRDVTGSSDFQVFAITGATATTSPGSGALGIVNDKLYINPTSDFSEGNQYSVRIDATAIDDASGNSFAGIADDTTFNFTTAATSATSTAASFSTSSGANLTPSFSFDGDDETLTLGAASHTSNSVADGSTGTDTLVTVDSADLTLMTTLTNFETLTIPASTSVTMSSAQHELFTTFTDNASQSITITSGSDNIGGDSAIESYTLGASYSGTFTLGAASQNVAGADSAVDTVSVGTLTVTGDITGGSGEDVLQMSSGSSIAGANTLSGFETVEITGSVTMTEAQHDAFTTAITAAGGSDQITISAADGDASVTADADVETYVLGAGMTIIHGAAGQNITGSSSADTISTSLTVTGTLDAGSGTDTLSLGNGADIDSATVSNFENLTLANDASVAVNATQLLQFTGTITASGSETITVNNDGDITTLATTVIENYSVADDSTNTRTITLGSGHTSGAITANSADDAVTFNIGTQSFAGTLTGEGTINDTVQMGNGSSIASATLNNIENLTVDSGAAVTMTEDQHDAFTGTITASGTNQITISAATDGFTAYADIENYVLGAANTVTLGTSGGSLTQNVTGSSGNDTITLGAATYTGTFDGNTGTGDTLSVANSTNISGASVSNIENLTLASGATLTMAASDLADFSGSITAPGTEQITVSGDGSFSTLNSAAIETYSVNDDSTNARTITLGTNDTATDISATSSSDAITFSVPGITYTGTLTGEGTTNDTLQLANNADVSSGVLSAIEVLSIASGGSVTLSAAQYSAFTSQTITAPGTGGSGETIIINGTGDITLNSTTVETYTIEDDSSDTRTITLGSSTSNTFTASSTSDAITLDISTFDFSGAFTADATVANTLVSDGSNDIASATLSGFTNLTLDGASNDLTLTVAQLNAFSGTITGSGTDTLTLSGSGSVTGGNLSAIETFATGSAGSITITIPASDVSNKTLTATTSSSDSFTVTGSASSQTINGSAGGDNLSGGDGADIINGNAGNDTLNGGAGADTLSPGAGTDSMSGSDGNDIFSGSASELTGDTITDLSEGDTVKITGVTGLTTSNVRFNGSNTLQIDTDATDFSAVEVAITLSNSAGDSLNILAVTDNGSDTDITFENSNNVPVFSGLDNNPSFTEDGSAVVMDDNVTVADTELDALNSSSGNYSGATLTIARNGGADADDEFSASGLLGDLTASGNLTYDSLVYGTVTTNGSGTLVLTFSDASNIPTTAIVASIMQAITYSNGSEAPDTSVTLDWTFNDGTDNSTGTNQVLVSVTAQNDAPVLDSAQSPTLTAINEDAGDDDGDGADGDDDGTDNTNNSGTDVATIVVDSSITDPDGSAVEAIAVVTVDNTNGVWQYSTDNGTNWNNFSGTTGQSVDLSVSARLLDGSLSGANTHKIRFVPSQNYNGTATITFRAWDKSAGTAGGTADTSTNGGTTAFSSVSDSAAITVNSVNDAPSVDTNTGVTVERGSNITIGSSALSTSDTEDGAANVTYTVTAVPTLGALQLSDGSNFSSLSNSDTFTQDDIDNNRVRYVHAGGVNSSDSFSFSVADQNSGSVTGQSFNITIQDTTAPTITAVSIPNSSHKVGDTVTATITVTSDADTYTLGASTVAGYTLGGLSKTNDTTYTATFTVGEDGTDYAAASDIPVSIVLTDSSANNNAAFTTAISQAGDAIYANTPELTLSTNSTTIAEDAGVATVTVAITGSLNNQWPEDIGVSLAYSGTATNATDYTRSTSSVTISAGNSSTTITITGVADDIFDALSDETVIVDIDCIITGNATEAAAQTQTITITDAESAPTVTLSVDNSTIPEDGSSSATATATLSTATFENVIVNLAYSGTATSNDDYGAFATAAMTVAAGQTSVSVGNPVTATQDTISEGDETVIIDVANVSGGGATEATTQQVTITIEDDDNTAPVMTDLVSSLTINEDTLTNLGLSDTTFTDAQNDSLTVTLAVNSGTLSSPLGSSGGVTVSGADSASMTLTGLSANLNTFLDNANAVAITPAENSTSAITLTVTPNDGTVDGTVGNTTINITPINDAPSLNNNGDGGDIRLWRTSANTGGNLGGRTGADSFCDGDANKPTVASSQTRAFISVSDSDEIRDMATLYSIPTSSAIFRLDGTTQIAPDFAALLDAGATALTNSVNGMGGIAGAAFTGSNADGSLNTNNCSGWTTASTGNGMSGLGNSTNGGYLETGVTGCGNTTVIGLFCLTYAEGQVTIALSMDEDAGAQSIFSSAQISDVDSPSATFTLTLTLSDTTAGTLGGTASGSAQLSVNGGTLTLSGTLTDVNASLASITYTPAENYNGSDATLSVTVTDGTSTSSAINGSITVAAVNDAPTIGTNAGLTVDEGATGVITTSLLADSDPDDTGTELTFTVTTAVTNGTLFLDADDDDTADPGEELTVNSTFTQQDLADGNIQYAHDGGETTSDSFVFSLADGGEDSASTLTDQTFSISITSVNETPVITSSEVTSATEDSAYSYTISATDVDAGDSLTFAAPTLPSWLSFASGTGVLSGTPANDDVGSHNVVLTVTDSGNLSATQSFTITVANTNDAPVITSTAVTSATEDSAYSYTLTASDVDVGDSLTMTATTLPDWLSFNSTTGVLSGTPTNDEVGDYSVALSVSDNSSATDSQSFTLTVSNTNDAPVITSTAVTSATEDSVYSYTLTATDVDAGDSLTMTATTLPDWLAFNSSTGVLSGTPTNDEVGDHSVVLSVSDSSSAADSQSFTITVVNVNDAPTIDQGDSVSVNMSEDAQPTAFSLTLSATDVENDAISWSISNGAAQGAVSVNQNGVVSYSPDANYNGPDSFSVTASDGELSDTVTVSVNVQPINDAPTISGSPGSSVAEGSRYSFTPSASDIEDDVLTFSASNLPAWLVLNTETGNISGTPDADDVGTYDNIVLSVTDSAATASLRAFSITVTNVNEAPVISGTPSTLVEVDTAYSFVPEASDADGDTLSFSVENLPAWLTLDTATGAITGTPTSGDVAEYENIVLTVSDGELSASLAAFSIEVIDPNVNVAPVVEDVSATTEEDAAAEITLLGSDLNDDALSYVVVTEPENGTVVITNNIATYTPASDFNGTDSFTYQASDSILSSEPATVTVTVSPVNDAPTISGEPTTQIAIGVEYSFTPEATDIDSESLTFSIENMPSWASFDENTGTLSGVPEEGDIGSFTDINISVSDGELEASLATFEIEVIDPNVNTAPVSSDSAVETEEDTPITFTLEASDEDGDTLTYTITTEPASGTIEQDGSSVTYTPNANVGDIQDSLSFTVSDGVDTSEEATVTIDIIAVNDAPEISGTPANSVRVGMVYEFTPVATDVENDTLTFTIENQPRWAAFDGNTGTLSGTPGNSDVGTYGNITISVSDGTETVALAAFNVEVLANSQPLISGTSASAVEPGQSYSFTPVASDPDGDTLTFSIENQPDWTTFDADTGSLSGIPGSDDIGNYSNIVISVTDGIDTVSLPAFNLEVCEVCGNVAPTISGLPVTSITEGDSYLFTPSASDVNGDELTFSIVNQPVWANFDSNTGTLSGTPGIADIGTTTGIVISVTDGEFTVSLNAFSITVLEFNDAPVISGTPATSVFQNDEYRFTPTASDAEGDTLVFSISNRPAWAAFNTRTGTLRGTPVAENVGSYADIVISVNDGQNSSSLDSFSITVVARNNAPTISGTPRTAISQNVAYSFTPTASDADGDGLTFSASGLPDWLSINSATGALTGTPGTEDVGTTGSIVLSVSDGTDSASLNAFTITVTEANAVPVANDSSVSVDEDSSVSITPSVSDGDGDTLTFVIVDDVQNGSLTETSTGWTYTPDADFNGSDSFVYQADDGESSSEEATISITVNSINDRPVAVADTIVLDQNDSGVYTLDVLANDLDVDIATNGDVLTLQGVQADFGNVSVVNNQIQFEPGLSFIGAVDLQYAVRDNARRSAQARVNLTINGVAGIGQPVLTVPNDLTVDADGLFTEVDLGVAEATDADGNPLPVFLVNATNSFKPGTRKVFWQTEDSFGSVTTDSQTLHVNPLISLGKDKVVNEDSTVRMRVLLNGDAPAYPLTVNYTVSGTATFGEDHNAQSGSVTFTSGREQIISFNVFADDEVESDETIIFALNSGQNLGANNTSVVTISEENIAPEIRLMVSQSGDNRLTVAQDEGSVVINATVTDANPQDSLDIDWISSGLSNSSTSANQFSFEPSDVATGIYQVSLFASDNGDPILSNTADVFIEVVDSLAVLSEDLDTDGDLIPDSQEGYADSDGDGIPDYLDAIDECNVVPEQAANQEGFLVESEPGVCLRQGAISALNSSDGLEVILDATTGGKVTLNRREDSVAQRSDGLPEDPEATNIGGIFDFILYNLPEEGQIASIVLPQTRPVPKNAVYRKYSVRNERWTDFVINDNNQVFSAPGTKGVCPPPGSSRWMVGLTEGHWCVQLRVLDGGINDDDGLVNGAIADPGGVAVVLAGNSLPDIQNDDAAMQWNTSIEIDVLANDSDVDGDTLTIASVDASFGTADITSSDTIIYTPDSRYVGTDVLIYAVSDGNGGTGSGEVTVTINGNRAPGARSDSASTTDDMPIEIDVLANDTDVDGDPLTIDSATVDVGEVMITANNTLLYTPANGFDGLATITYVISDSFGETDSATVSVVVEGNQSPQATDDSVNTEYGTSVVITVLDNDMDVDGDTLTVVSATADSGSVVVNSDQTLTFTPATGFSGLVTISYVISDGELSDEGTVRVTVAQKPVEIVNVTNKSGGGAFNLGWLMVLLLLGFYRQNLQKRR